MLVYMFKSLLITSLIGIAATLVLALLRPFTKKFFSSVWHYYIWLVVLVVMILPVRISLPEQTQVISEIEAVDVSKEEAVIYNEIQQAEQESELNTEQVYITDNSKDKLYSQENLYPVSVVWLLGVVILFAIKLMGYILFILRLHSCSSVTYSVDLSKYTDKRIAVRISDKISSPLMTGVFKPTLLLPETAMDEEQLNNVLAHEMIHFKRKDILLKWFVSIVKCIHWFNPAVYYISRQADIECEISCDLAVVKGMSKEQEAKYISTILALISAGNRRTAALTTGMTSDKKTLKRRFMMIKNKVTFNKKTLTISIILAVILLCGTVLASGLLNYTFISEYENELLSVSTDIREGDDFNFLFVGVDEGNRADTVMLLSLDNGNVTVTSIPRDTAFVSREFDRNVKLSEILNTENGNQNVIDAVRDNFAVPVHYYAKLKLRAVKEIVDSVGGVEFNVPMDMEYDDPYQGLHIKLKKGWHTLDGDAVCGLLRFRRSNTGAGYAQGDMTRIEIGQQFVSEFINQKLNRSFVNKLPDIVETLDDNLETNYPVADLIDDIELLGRDIEFCTIEGSLTTDDTGIAFYDVNSGNVVSVVSEPKLVADVQTEASAQHSQSSKEQKETVTEQTELNEDFGCRPVEGEIAAAFGRREHPITKEVREHNGIDIKAQEGSVVVSSIAGTVTDVGFDKEKGNYIVVEKGNVKTVYAQLATTNVNKGDTITVKQFIGTVGKTGTATGAHLHFEVIVDGEYIDPVEFIQ